MDVGLAIEMLDDRLTDTKNQIEGGDLYQAIVELGWARIWLSYLKDCIKDKK